MLCLRGQIMEVEAIIIEAEVELQTTLVHVMVMLEETSQFVIYVVKMVTLP